MAGSCSGRKVNLLTKYCNFDLNSIIFIRREREFAQTLRQQQDQAYEESLRVDREKERLRQLEREQKIQRQLEEEAELEAERQRRQVICKFYQHLFEKNKRIRIVFILCYD